MVDIYLAYKVATLPLKIIRLHKKKPHPLVKGRVLDLPTPFTEMKGFV
jgi:hypothetical protein